MRLLELLAEALSAEKEQVLKDKYVVGKDEKGFQPNKMTQKEFDVLLKIDESPNGKYLNWIIPRYVKLDRTERARFFQDGHSDRVKEFLLFFDSPETKTKVKKASKNPNYNVEDFKADINQYKTLGDFENSMASVQAELLGKDDSESDVKPTSGEPYFVKKLQFPQKVGVTNSGWTVYKIPTKCKGNKDCYEEYRQLIGCRGSEAQNQARPKLPYGKITTGPPTGFAINYCTRYPNQFEHYIIDGPYYVFINWDEKRIMQLHYESGQLKDENDSEINGYNSKLQNEFLQFLLDNEGRIPTKSLSFNLNLKKFRQGEIDGFPIYKIGPLYYIDAKTGEDQQNKLVYFDSDTSQVKNADGKAASVKQTLRAPYDKLVKYLYKEGLFTPEKGTPAYSNWMAIRVFGNIDIPPTSAPKTGSSINLSGTAIESLPNNLTIGGDLDLSGTKLKQLPDNLTVGGTLNLKGTGLKPKSDTRAGKILED